MTSTHDIPVPAESTAEAGPGHPTPATPYVADRPSGHRTSEQLQAEIPGWGVDLDPADRPSVPREQRGLETGAHWEFPERQPQDRSREHSIEHQDVTPVFGTAQPMRGLSAPIRAWAYGFSEARAAHWLGLLAADRVDAWEHQVRSVLSARPDNPVTETRIRSELTGHGLASRRGENRADTSHAWMDPIIVAGPWVLAGGVVLGAVRALRRASRRA
ncbi:hypothetical protein [Citricoccus sp. GCM10030269]|uniref:hypothetical protein n=1 Tax=Citricoccus sp. GCM10030269 TaxID=3273388 RepID=UPI00360AA7BB